MEYINKQFLLDKRPVGMPEDDCWKLNEESITSIKNNEIIMEVKYLSIDPYMRGRMNDSKSYAAPAKIGEPMTGETAGVVVESNSDLYNIGDKVCAHKGWQTYIRAKDTDPALMKVPEGDIKLSAYLGTLGMPGRTAYFGLNRVGKPKSGETIVVSAASGAVGTVVGQLGKEYGCRVIGIAGGPEKCSFVKDELKFDYCIDYKAENLDEELKKACPNGVDIYFDNVGGEISDNVISNLSIGARIAICGQISLYNLEENEKGDRVGSTLLINQASMTGFLVFQFKSRYLEGLSKLSQWLLDEKIKYKEDIVSGIENAPDTFIGMMKGKNFGKLLIKIT